MRTTLNIDPELLKGVIEATGEKNKSRAVDRVMQDFLRRQAIKRLLAARGAFPDIVDNTEELKRLELEKMKKLEW